MRGVAAAMFALFVLAGFVSAGALLVLAAIGSVGPRDVAESRAVGARPQPAAPEPAAPAFAPFWVKNHRVTEMWSGPARDRTSISFGQTSNTFCSFRIDLSDDDARVYVYNPYADGRFWIDAEAVGPVVPPQRLRGPKPPDQNCAEAIYNPFTGTPVTPTPTASSTPTAGTPSTPSTPGTPGTPATPATPSTPRATGPPGSGTPTTIPTPSTTATATGTPTR